jgi:hypothetical protein
VRGPGAVSTNIAVGRAFELRERLKMTIRLEGYNVINHTNFSLPAAQVLTIAANSQGVPYFNNATYGLLTGAGQARFLQLAARFDF